jgi:hypothetical protein
VSLCTKDKLLVYVEVLVYQTAHTCITKYDF